MNDDHCLRLRLEDVMPALTAPREPNAAIWLPCDHAQQVDRLYTRGEQVRFTECVPCGHELLAMTFVGKTHTHVAGISWDVTELCFGTWFLVHPDGPPVPLADLKRLTTDNHLSVFAGKRLRVDMTVRVSLVCKEDALFGGYRLDLYNPWVKT